MPRDLTPAVIIQKDAQGKRPVLLFELGLSSTIRFAAYKTNIVFPTAGNTYTAKAINVSNATQSLEGQIGRMTIKFDNVARDMAAYSNNEDFRGKSLIIKRIYLDAVGNISDYNEMFNGYMEKPTKISRHWLTVPSTFGKPLNRKSLIVPYQLMCPWVFGDTECNTDGNSNLSVLTATGTADSGTTATLVDSALTQADDHWNNGNINITKAGVKYFRKVKDFVAASDTITFDVELPVTIDNTCTYEVFKGCDQTWDTCNALNAWGPSSDNHLNSAACLHITKPQDAE